MAHWGLAYRSLIPVEPAESVLLFTQQACSHGWAFGDAAPSIMGVAPSALGDTPCG